MLEDELRAILAELADQVGAVSVEIATGQGADTEAPDRLSERVRTLALGAGATLVVHLAGDANLDRDADIERAGRAIRAAVRRWQKDAPPPIHSSGPTAGRAKVLDRMRVFLQALCGSTSAEVAVVTRHGKLVASAGPLTELQESRVPFAVKRVEAEAAKQTSSSHAILFGDDYFAATFYYGAALVSFTSAPLAPDFVRFHVRQVCRELSHMLALLDEEPPDPAHVAPV